jgi:hypothetical protein
MSQFKTSVGEAIENEGQGDVIAVMEKKGDEKHDLEFLRWLIEGLVREELGEQLKRALEHEKMKKLFKPLLTVKTMKIAITERQNEEITMILLKALFDLNLKLEDYEFTSIVSKIVDYIKDQGFTRALKYLFKRYDPAGVWTEEDKEKVMDETEKNRIKNIKMVPNYEKWKKEKGLINGNTPYFEEKWKEESKFYESQKSRGISPEKEKWMEDEARWVESKREWDEKRTKTSSNFGTFSRPRPYYYKTNKNLSEQVEELLNLKKAGASPDVLDETVKTILGNVNETLYPTRNTFNKNTRGKKKKKKKGCYLTMSDKAHIDEILTRHDMNDKQGEIAAIKRYQRELEKHKETKREINSGTKYSGRDRERMLKTREKLSDSFDKRIRNISKKLGTEF